MRVSRYSQFKKILNSSSSFLYLVLFLLFLSSFLIYANINNKDLQNNIKRILSEPLYNIAMFVSSPINLVKEGVERIFKVRGLYSELEDYNKKKLQETSSFQELISLKMKVTEYEKILELSEEIEYKYFTAKITGNFSDQFMDNIFINAGKLMSLKIDSPIMGENGIIGRVSEVNNKTSRVLLLTDVSSRVPVSISNEGYQGILIGNGKGNPIIRFVSDFNKVRVGDIVATSGKGGVFPSYILVGNVLKKEADFIEVKLHEDIDDLNYVRVLVASK